MLTLLRMLYFLTYFFNLFLIGVNRSQGCQTTFNSAEIGTSGQSRCPEDNSGTGEEKPTGAQGADEKGRGRDEERTCRKRS